MITANATSDSLTSHGYEYFFRLAPTNMMFIRDMEQYLLDLSAKDPADDIDVKSVAVCADNTELGQQTATWANTLWKRTDWSLRARFFTPRRGGFDQRGAAVKVPESGRLIVDNYVSDAILLTKTMNEQGYKPNIMIAKQTVIRNPLIFVCGSLAKRNPYSHGIPAGGQGNQGFGRV